MSLKPCPWCQESPIILLCTEEGDIKSESYLEDPYSGVGYALSHPVDDCPIGTHQNEFLGTTIYDAYKEAEDAWNKGVCSHTDEEWDDLMEQQWEDMMGEDL